jgi:hypothetical protein
MTITLIWFNGPSMRDWLHVPRQGIEIGCNYIRRDRPVDHVVCYDWQMLTRIEPESGVTRWCRDGFASQYKGWSEIHLPQHCLPEQSGTLAVTLAVDYLKSEKIIIVGCDWGLSTQSAYDYGIGRRSVIKHTNHQSRVLERLSTRHGDISLVGDEPRDVAIPHITSSQFCELLSIDKKD